MRTLEQYKTNQCNDELTITVLDERGPGNANHKYLIESDSKSVKVNIDFQNGPIKESGVNGVTGEALAAILIDRLEGFQSGPYACKDNEMALLSFKVGLSWLQNRTKERLARGVEGTHEK